MKKSSRIAWEAGGTSWPSYSKSQTLWEDLEEHRDISKLSPVTLRVCAWSKIFV